MYDIFQKPTYDGLVKICADQTDSRTISVKLQYCIQQVTDNCDSEEIEKKKLK